MTYLDRHTLYYRKSCPSCQKVLAYMNRWDIRLRTCDVSHPNNLRDLINLTGRRLVPCLAAHGRTFHDVDEIIEVITRDSL